MRTKIHFLVCMCAELLQWCLTLCDPMDCSPSAPLSMRFSRQEYWSGLPCPPPGDLPDPGMEPVSLTSPALAGRFFTASTTWEAHSYHAVHTSPQIIYSIRVSLDFDQLHLFSPRHPLHLSVISKVTFHCVT